MRYLGFKEKLSDFIVEEVLHRDRTPKGSYIYFYVEKKNFTTEEMIHRIQKFLDIPRKYIGIGGLKDKRAHAKQWICLAKKDILPHYSLPEWERLMGSWLKIYDVQYCDKPLHLGDNDGNRFIIRLRNISQISDEIFQDVVTQAHRHINVHGFRNLFGEQRFGFTGANRKIGAQLLRGSIKNIKNDSSHRGEKMMKIQSFASYCFNQFLFLREKKIGLHKRLDGDIMQKIGEKDLVTGPVPGLDLPLPLEKTQACVFEQKALQQIGLHPEDYERFGNFRLRGRRRPLLCYPQKFSLRFHQGDVIFSFFLPAGSYASVLFEEVDQFVFQFLQKKRI